MKINALISLSPEDQLEWLETQVLYESKAPN